MSKSDKIASGGEPEGQSTASVFDFLYNDSRRIGSYLAQLDENGHLTEVRRGEQASKNAKRGFSIGGQVLGTGGNLEWTPKEGGGESAERVYDPFWANARELLDALDERDMIHRGLSDAQIGSLVLVSGQMSIVDLSLFKVLWSLPAIRKLMTPRQPADPDEEGPQPNRQMRRAGAKKPLQPRPKGELEQNTELMLEMLPVLPHSLNAIMAGQGAASWATLKEEHLIGTGSDLILKHGIAIPGEWQMLGILDAQPDLGGQADIEANNQINFADLSHLESHSLVEQLARIMSPIVRVLLGRPGSHYGITPLLIFRQVGHAGI